RKIGRVERQWCTSVVSTLDSAFGKREQKSEFVCRDKRSFREQSLDSEKELQLLPRGGCRHHTS
ncbi:MAG: hypothetical protein ACM36C_15385, partial [Acidobacteriota bacterium]